MAGTVAGDRLNQFIREQPYFSAGLSTQVEKRGDNLWYWRNTGLPVNVRRANGRSGKNVATSAKAAQAARRAGPGAGPVSAREMYAQLKAEVEGELKARGLLPAADECPIIPPQALDDFEMIFADSEAIYPEARGLLLVADADMAGGAKYKQRGGAFLDQLKRLMTILCMLPRETVRVVDQEATAAVRQTADALLQDLPHTAETGARVLQRLPAGLVALLLAGDLGSNNSLTIRAINAIISVIGYFVNPALTMSWYRGLLGNIASLVYGSTPELAGIAAVIAINYQGVRVFQEIYRRLRGEAGPDQARAAQHAFEGTVVQFIGYLTRRARMEALRRLPAERLPAGLRQEVLDADLAEYMARVPDAQELRRIRENQIPGRRFGVGVVPRLANRADAAEGAAGADAAAAAPGYNWLGVLRGELPAGNNVNDMEPGNVAPGAAVNRATLNAEIDAYMAQHPGRLAAAERKKKQGGGRGKSRRASKRTVKHRKNTRKA